MNGFMGSYVYLSNLEATSSQMTRGLAKLRHQIVLSSRFFLSCKYIKYYLRAKMMIQYEKKKIVFVWNQYLVSSRYESLFR